LYWSERTGTPQAFRLDLKTGESEILTKAQDLVGLSLTLAADERSFFYFDGPVLCRSNLSNLSSRTVYRLEQGWELFRGFTLSSDNRNAVLCEKSERKYRLRVVELSKGNARTILESENPHSDPLTRPRASQILFREGKDALCVVGFDGRRYRRLKLAEGGIGPAFWSAGGSSILYLNFPGERRKLNAIREHFPETNEDRLVSETSQFAAFSPDGDASVFIGASANRASPHILLLHRASKRELTLCEHRASNPAAVCPVFSPDSQQVYFQSDCHGKSAIYAMRVDRLVEKTET
jgi:oligogalacturonide lyase